VAARSLNTIQATRAVACIAVLLYHTDVTLNLPKYFGHDVFPVFRGGGSGVQLFFVISGFVILLAHEKDLDKPAKITAFLWKRFRRIYPPLWIVLMLITPVYLLFPGYGVGHEGGAASILSTFLLYPVPADYLLTPAWTLRHEVLFYLLFSLVIWRKSVGLLVVTLWLALCMFIPWTNADFPLSFLFSSNHLLFAFGMAACICFKGIKPCKAVALAGAMSGAVGFVSVWHADIIGVLTLRDVMNVLYGAAASVTILSLVLLERDWGLRVSRPLVFLGEASYAIYLVHYPALSIAVKTIRRMRWSLEGERVAFLISAFSALVAGVMFHLMVERPVLARLSKIQVDQS
jgi:exopolysaccharide production protein ExoZ